MNGYPVRGGNPLQKIVRSSEKLVWAKSEGLSPLHKIAENPPCVSSRPISLDRNIYLVDAHYIPIDFESQAIYVNWTLPSRKHF